MDKDKTFIPARWNYLEMEINRGFFSKKEFQIYIFYKGIIAPNKYVYSYEEIKEDYTQLEIYLDAFEEGSKTSGFSEVVTKVIVHTWHENDGYFLKDKCIMHILKYIRNQLVSGGIWKLK